jgi:hypothetical protein
MRTLWQVEGNVMGGGPVTTPPLTGSPRMFMPVAISDQNLDAGKGEKTGIS